MNKERRKHPRHTLRTDVSLTSGDNFFAGATRDLSMGGVYLETTATLEIGQVLEVSLGLGGKHHAIKVEVMWTLSEQGRPVGAGLSFVDMSRTARRAIAAFMRHRPPVLVEQLADGPLSAPRPPPLPPPLPPAP